MTIEEFSLFNGLACDMKVYSSLINDRNKLQSKLKKVLNKIQAIDDALSCFDDSDESDKVSKLNLDWVKYQGKAHKLENKISDLEIDIRSFQYSNV